MANAMNADDFARAVKAYADKTVQLIAKEVVSQTFMKLSTLVIQATPILTGQARSNWQPSVDSPITETIERLGELGASADEATNDLTGAPLTGEEKDKLNQTIQKFKQGDGKVLYLSNNLDYIEALDEGSSSKAPAGMVEPSIQATLALLRDKQIKIGS